MERTFNPSVVRQHTDLSLAIEQLLRGAKGPGDINRLAESVSYSRFHLSRRFREVRGETLNSFVQRLRLERAAYAILNSDQLVKAIASDCGYRSPEAFSRAFRKLYGALPTSFKTVGRDWRIGDRTEIHWNPDWHGHPITGLETKVGHFGTRFACVRRFVGSYCDLESTWREFGSEFGGLAPPNARFVTLYLDNFLTHPVLETMRADLGWLALQGEPVPEGMVIREIPAGIYAFSEFVPRTRRRDVWSYMIGRYGSLSFRTEGLCSFDEYDRLPLPFDCARTRASIGLPTKITQPAIA